MKNFIQPDMAVLFRRVWGFGWLLALFAQLVATPVSNAAETNVLVWNQQAETVTADVRDWDLMTLLESVAGQTGWHVFVEYDPAFRSSVKFKELPATQALRRLLGDLNFALLPQTNGPQNLYVFRTSMSQATREVRTAKTRPALKSKPIPNELIVRVRPGTDIEALAKALGAKVVGSIPELNAYRLQFEDEAATEEARKKLSANADVVGVESNYSIEPPFTPQSLGGMSPPGQSVKFDPVKRDASKITIGLVDSGLQKLDPALEQFIKERVSMAGEVDLSSLSPTHATSMVNAMVQAMQQAGGSSGTGIQIVSLDIFGSNGGADSFTGAMAMYEAYKRGVTVINDSWGNYGQTQLLADVIKFLGEQGVSVFAAMGNDGSTTPFYPAAFPGVVAVTATERGQIAPYANIGIIPDAAAPGQVIFGYNGLTYGSRGTSVSSAAAAAIAARLAEMTGATGAQLNTAVQNLLIVPGGK